MKIEIETSNDTHDCETCGSTWAEGGTVTIDGEVVLDLEPLAHCFGGQNYSETDLLVMALAKVGIDVDVDGGKWHITCHNDDYHGVLEYVQ